MTQHFMLPSFLSLSLVVRHLIFTIAQLLVSPSQSHSCSFVLTDMFGLCNILPFYSMPGSFHDLSDLIAATPLKTTNTCAYVHMHTEGERERKTYFLYLEGSLSDALEDNGRHIMKFDNDFSCIISHLCYIQFT